MTNCLKPRDPDVVQILSESTYEAIRLGLSEKFLAEGQPEIGRNGHVLAAVTHRYIW